METPLEKLQKRRGIKNKELEISQVGEEKEIRDKEKVFIGQLQIEKKKVEEERKQKEQDSPNINVEALTKERKNLEKTIKEGLEATSEQERDMLRKNEGGIISELFGESFSRFREIIKEIRTDETFKKELSSLETQVSELETRIAELRHKPIDRIREKLQQEVNELEKEYTELKNKKEEIEKEKDSMGFRIFYPSDNEMEIGPIKWPHFVDSTGPYTVEEKNKQYKEEMLKEMNSYPVTKRLYELYQEDQNKYDPNTRDVKILKSWFKKQIENDPEIKIFYERYSKEIPGKVEIIKKRMEEIYAKEREMRNRGQKINNYEFRDKESNLKNLMKTYDELKYQLYKLENKAPQEIENAEKKYLEENGKIETEYENKITELTKNVLNKIDVNFEKTLPEVRELFPKNFFEIKEEDKKNYNSLSEFLEKRAKEIITIKEIIEKQKITKKPLFMSEKKMDGINLQVKNKVNQVESIQSEIRLLEDRLKYGKKDFETKRDKDLKEEETNKNNAIRWATEGAGVKGYPEKIEEKKREIEKINTQIEKLEDEIFETQAFFELKLKL